MKNLFCLLFILTALTSYICFGQDKIQTTENKWMRIETTNKDLSVSFPPVFLVDAEKKDYDGQRQRIIAFQNGVQMELTVYDVNDPKESLRGINESDGSKNRGFTAHGFIGKRFSSNDDKEFSESIFLASKKNLYHLFVRTKTIDKQEVSRFIYSIKAGNKPLFISKDAINDATEEIVSIASLKTNPEILEALNRKSEKSNRKISYESEDGLKITNEINDSIRPSIILVEPHPMSYAVKPTVYIFRKREGNGAAKIKVKLLANGQVGDITVFSKADRTVIYDFIEGVKEIKFLPAMKDGKPVDSEWIFNLEAFGF